MVAWHLQPKYSGQSPSMSKPRKSHSSRAAAKREKKAKLKKKSEKHVKNDLSDASCTAVKTSEELRDEAEADIGFILAGLEEMCTEESVDEGERRVMVEARAGRDMVSAGERKEAMDTGEGREIVREECRCSDPERERLDVQEEEQKETEPLHGHTSPCLSRDKDSTAAASQTSENAELASLGYKTFKRYYHVFCRNELTELFSRVQGVRVVEEFYDHENWCVLAEKIVDSQ